jgi:phosphonate transport system ATP-binding protein
MELLAEVGGSRGIPVLVNMHDVELARRFADRIIGMRAGRIVFDGPATDVSEATLTAIYGGEGWLH